MTLLLRRIRSDAGVVVLLFAVIATTSFVFAAAPRLLNRVTDDAVRYAVTMASPGEREVRLTATGQIAPGNLGGVSAVEAYGADRAQDLPATVDRLVSERHLGITSPRLAVSNSIVALWLRHQDGVPDDTRLVDGRWPVDRGMPLELNDLGGGPGPIVSPQRVRFLAGPNDPPNVFEAAVSAAAADQAGINVGDRLTVALDRSDPSVRALPYNLAPTEVEVVGLFEPLDPDADEWASGGLLEPSFRFGPGGVEAINVTAYVSENAYANLQASQLPFRYDWRYPIDPDRIDAGQVAALQDDLQRLSLVAATDDQRTMVETGARIDLRDVTFGGNLSGILADFAAQRDRSLSVLAIAALGPLCLAGAAIGMLGVLLIRRRRGSLLLARGRGASPSLLLGAALGEAIVISASAALAGLALATIAVAARDAPLSPVLAGVVAALAVALLVAAAWPTARRPLMQLERDDPPLLHVPARRLVFEATIVVIAIVAIVLLRQRGLTVGGGAAGQVDPLLLAVPLLAALAAGIIAMRLYPIPVRALGWLAARRRDFVPSLGLRTAARHPAAAQLSLLVLMLAAAFASFASVIESSINRGQVAASYLEVGADYRLEDIGLGALPTALDPISVPGVEAVAGGLVDPRAIFIGNGNERATVEFNAIDADGYSAVTANTLADPRWPRAFLAQAPGTDSAVGTPANPIPAVASADFPPGNDELRPGDTFTVELRRQPLTFRLVERRPGIPGLGIAANSLTAPLDWLRAALPDEPPAPTVMWLRAPRDAADSLATMVGGASSQVRIVSRDDAYALIHDAPLGTAVAEGFGISLAVAVMYLTITLVGAVIMSAASRTRDLAYLRTLGMSRRQALGLTALEHAPPVLIALIPGVLLGVAVANLVEPGLGLEALMGAGGVPLSVDWATLGLVVVALFAVVVGAIAAGTWLAARSRLVSALRIGES